jgi:hypothetical protein
MWPAVVPSPLLAFAKKRCDHVQRDFTSPTATHKEQMNRVCLIFLSLLAFFACVASARADGWQKLRDHGAEVYYADLDLRAAFAKANPKGLPPFLREVPPATASAFDWTRLLKPARVLDQKKSICCWAYAGVTAFEYSWAIRNGSYPPPLALQPMLDRVGKDGSGYAGWALQDLLEHGTCTAGAYPHVGRPGKLNRQTKMPYRAIAWGRVSPKDQVSSVPEIKQALVDHGPLVSCVFDTAAFVAYKGGIYQESSKLPPGPAANHLVVIVGWDDRRGASGCWKIQSSWGHKWGEDGFMWLEYGSNYIGDSACWVRAQAKQYRLPGDIHRQINAAAEPFPAWLGARTVALSPSKPMPVLTPAEALKREGERIVLECVVQGGGTAPWGDVELTTEKSWKDDGCILIRLLKSDLHKFGNGNEGVLQTYRLKKIRVHGSLQNNPIYLGEKLLGDRPFIEVADSEQIEILCPSKPMPVLTPAEALKHEGEQIVLECVAQAGGTAPWGDVELNTEKSWKDDGCILIRLLKSELHKFGTGNEAVLGRYLGRKIRVHGLLRNNLLYVGGKLLGDRPFIEVADPEQIEIVK